MDNINITNISRGDKMDSTLICLACERVLAGRQHFEYYKDGVAVGKIHNICADRMRIVQSDHE